MATHRTSSFLQRDPTPDALARIAVNDSALTPKPFRGNDGDAEKTEQWLDYFTTYTNFRDIHGNSRLQLLKLLLTDQAADWLRSLEHDQVDDYDTLVRLFRR